MRLCLSSSSGFIRIEMRSDINDGTPPKPLLLGCRSALLNLIFFPAKKSSYSGGNACNSLLIGTDSGETVPATRVPAPSLKIHGYDFPCRKLHLGFASEKLTEMNFKLYYHCCAELLSLVCGGIQPPTSTHPCLVLEKPLQCSKLQRTSTGGYLV